MSKFTLLRVDLTTRTRSRRSARSAQYEAETLPAVRVVSPEGKIVAKLVDASAPAERFREMLEAASAHGQTRGRSGALVAVPRA